MPDIDSMTGRELDAAVAERVMGCHWEGRRLLDAKGDCQFYRDQNGGIQANMEGNAFSSDWSAAALVVERMRELSFSFGCWHVPLVSSVPCPFAVFRWSVHPPKMEDRDAFFGYGETIPEAICRAALKAREARS